MRKTLSLLLTILILSGVTLAQDRVRKDLNFVEVQQGAKAVNPSYTTSKDVIFSQGFNDATFPPTGWTRTQLGTGTTNWVRVTTGMYAGTGGAQHAYSASSVNPNSWLVSPPITLGSGAYSLTFWEKNQYVPTWYDYSGVLISSGSGDAGHADFVEIYESAVALASYAQMEIDISEYAGQTIYIAFVYQGSDAHNWWVDEVAINETIIVDNDAAAISVDMFPNIGTGLPAEVGGTVKNTGELSNTFAVTITITNAESETVFVATESVTVEPGQQESIDFGLWTPEAAGAYTATLETGLFGDENPNNNIVTRTINVINNLIWGKNIDFTGSTSGIISTNLGALPNGLIETADDFILPDGIWMITSVRPVGFQTAGTLTGYQVKIYADNEGAPGDEVFSTFVASTVTTNPILTFANPLILPGGHYWLMVAGNYPTASAVAGGRWNWTTWNKLTANAAMLRDNPELFGVGNAWNTLAAIGVAGAGSTNFAIYGTNEPFISPTAADYVVDDPDDVTTTITWVSAEGITSISDGTYELVAGEDFFVTELDEYTSTLTISESYLATVLEALNDEVVLTITFDTGDEATFTITADVLTIVSVGTFSPISALMGTAFEDLPLPAQVQVTLNNGETALLDVVWAAGTYNPGAAGAYTLTGAIQLVNGSPANPSNFVTTIVVNVVYVAGYVLENFDQVTTLPAYWTSNFTNTAAVGVNGTRALRRNLWSSAPTGFWQTPLTAAGEDLYFSFMYKVYNYSGGGATPAGTFVFTFKVSTDFGATFEDILVIDGTNHEPSTNFALVEVDMSDYADADYVIVRMDAQWISGDYYATFDNVMLGTFYDATFAVSNGTEPVEGANVTLTGVGSMLTDADGLASFVVPNGTFSYSVAAAGYLTFNGEVTVQNSDALVDVELLAINQVTFTVTNAETALIEGATISYAGIGAGYAGPVELSGTLTTNASGVASVFLPNGEYTFTAYKVGYYEVEGDFDVEGVAVNVPVVLPVAPPILTATPSPLVFGDVPVATTKSLAVTLKNIGTGTLTIQPEDIVLAGDAEFTLTPVANPISLTTNQTATVTIVFNPMVTGLHEATLTIVDNQAVETVVEITGNGFAFDVPMGENFNGTTFPPAMWTRWDGLLTEESTLVTTTTGWLHHVFGNLTPAANNAAYVNLYGTKKHWLVTPPINIGEGGANTYLDFDIALTPWTGTAQSTLGTTDKVAVVISTDGTWSSNNILIDWDATDVISPTGDHYTIPLDGYSGIVRIGFYAERPTGNTPDLRFYVDNVKVEERYSVTLTFVDDTPENEPLAETAITVNGVGYVTDPDGQLSFQLIPGSYSWTVDVDGFLAGVAEFDVVDADVEETFVLNKLYTITFTVTDQDGEPLADALFTFEGEEYELDADGMLEFIVINGTYEFTASLEGHTSVEDVVVVANADVEVEVILFGSFPVTFTVVDQNGLPLEGAIVDFNGEVVETDEDGLAEYIANVGTYTFTVTLDGYLGVEAEITVATEALEVLVTLYEFYEITLLVNPEEVDYPEVAGIVEGAGMYYHGQEVTVYAEPSHYWAFVNWTVDEEVVSEEAEFTFIAEGDITLVANFEYVPEAEILSFELVEQVGVAEIDSENATIHLFVNFEANLAELTPIIEVSLLATVSPASGETVDFSNSVLEPVEYVVTADDGSTKTWFVTVEISDATAARIEGITFYGNESAIDEIIIDNETFTVSVWVTFGTNVATLTPTITISFGATIDPVPFTGDITAFGVATEYTVTAADGEHFNVWSVIVLESPNTAAEIEAFVLAEQTGPAIIDSEAATVEIEVALGTDLSELTPIIDISANATIDPESSTPQDFTLPVVYTVTSQSGVEKVWTVYVTIEPNWDATLAEITIDEVALEGFESDVYDYVVELLYGTTIVPVVDAVATDANATIVITDAAELPGITTIEVTAEDGITVLVYTIEFTIGLNFDATLASLTYDGVLVPGFDSDVLEYAIVLPYGTTEVPEVDAVATDINATLVITQAEELPGVASVVVTAEDGISELTYSVEFTVAGPSTDATLANLTVDGVTVAGFNAAVLVYNVVLPYGTTVIPVVGAAASYPTATLVVNQATALPGAATVVVTAEDAETELTYTVNFSIAEPSTIATLSNLTVDGVTVAGFNPEILVYNVVVPFGTVEIPQVGAVAADPNADLVITQAVAIPGFATVDVTAEDGETELTYTVYFEFPPVYELPFAEDFTDVAVGAIPANWARTHGNWGAIASANAGGAAPEMRLNWSPSVTGELRLHTPWIDGDVDYDFHLSFRHMVNHYSDTYNISAQITTDGVEWESVWSVAVTGSISAQIIDIDLTDYQGETFMLAFVFTGNTFNLNYWYIDNVSIYEYIPPVYYDLTLVANPEEGGTVNGAGSYVEGHNVYVTATPATGYMLINWTDENGEIVSNSANFVFTMPAEDVTLTANFIVIENFMVTFNVENQFGAPVENAMISVLPTAKKATVPTTLERVGTSEIINNSDATLTAVSADSPVAFGGKDEWIHWDSGENTNGIGTNGVANFHIASRWYPADLAAYDGMVISKISFFPRFADCVYTVKVWTGADAIEIYSQVATNITPNEWNIVELDVPVVISAADQLWFGVNINTQGGHPAGCDAGPQVAGKGNMIYWSNTWQELTALNPALTYNWNIQAYVEAGVEPIVLYTNASGIASFEAPVGNYTYVVEKDNHVPASGTFSVIDSEVEVSVELYEMTELKTVTFNVDMTDVEGFDPWADNVYLTGSFTGWAEPGSPNSIQMTLVRNEKDPPYNFSESFEGFDDFATDLSPWTTYQVTTGPTYGSNSFDFPGEATEFAFMAFNPSQTTPPIADTHPAVDGSKYAIAVQYTSTNDNKWLITPELSINQTSQLSFWVKSITAQYGLERFKVMVSTTGTEPANFTMISAGSYLEAPTEWTQFTFDLSAFAGETVHIGINYVSYDAFFFMLDNFQVTAQTDVPEELIYTATIMVEPGTYEYKYFMNAGWDGGEWPGDPNRVVVVENDMVVNDTWGLPKYNLNLVANPLEGGVVSGSGNYVAGAEVNVSAVANDSYVFVNWTTASGVVVSEAPAFVYTMPEAHTTLVANFQYVEPTYYILTLLAEPVVGGTVYGAGEYYAGEDIAIGALANEGYEFVSWTDVEGNLVSASMQFVYTMPEADVTLIAHFEMIAPPTYTLTLLVNPEEGGYVYGEGEYEEGEMAYIWAYAEWGYEFISWTDEDGNVVSDVEEFVFTMPAADVTLTANFELGQYTIIVNVHPEEGGTVTFEPEQETYTIFDEVTLTAVPSEGYKFKHWKYEGYVIESDEVLEFEMPGMDLVLDAYFVTEDTELYTLTVVANPEEGGYVWGGGVYEAEEEAYLEAWPVWGYTFISWTDADGNVVSEEMDFTFVMPAADVTLTANFEEIATYNLTLLAVPEEGGEVYGAGEYFAGEEALVWALANDGFQFQNWRKNGVVFTSEDWFWFEMPAADVTLTAHFVPADAELYSLTLEVEPKEGGVAYGEGMFIEGEAVTIEAVANYGYAFVNWTDVKGDVVSDVALYEFEMPAMNLVLVANFELLPTYTVTFTVVDKVTTNALAGATVVLNGETVLTDADGKAVFAGLYDGSYDYTVSLGQTYLAETGTVVVEGADVELTVELEPVSASLITLSSVNAYPNPFSSRITIANAESFNRMVVTNLIGQVVMDVPLTGSQLTVETSSLSKGVYLMTFQANDGTKVVRRMVKQ